jgi:hypothetical protein
MLTVVVVAEVRDEASPKKLWTFGIFRDASINLSSINDNHHSNNVSLSKSRKAIDTMSTDLASFMPVCKDNSNVYELLTVERGSCRRNGLL